MRHPAFSATAALIALTSIVTLTTLTACEKPASAYDDLDKDLASLSSSKDFALAPTTGGRSTVSAVEQLTPYTTVAPSQRSAPHRTPHIARHATPSIIAPKVEPVSGPAPQPMATVAEAPMPVMAARPHPMAPAATPASSEGIRGADMPGGNGTIGTIFGVVIRGGVGDGDHCDPRPGRRMEPEIYTGQARPQIRY